jgi:hypothetical protein
MPSGGGPLTNRIEHPVVCPSSAASITQVTPLRLTSDDD